MKLETTTREVTTDGTMATAQFAIHNSAKAFKILIDRLYSDKIKAVCRELMTNAFDAHLTNGNPEQPFEVLLPNTYDSFFAVRDFGCSMTHEMVMGLYATVFKSTKDQDNNSVGQLGLGSKSPFAYSDTFTVTCWLDGEKRVYTAYLGEDEIPRIDLMLAEPSDEPQGVEVRIPTSKYDESTFLSRVKELAYGFDVLPIIKGRANFSMDAREVAFSGDGWRMFKKQGFSSEKMGIRQGCVIYPFNEHNVEGLSREASGLADLPVVIDFPIGEIDFTPSREEISYNKTTQANLVKRINAFAESFLVCYTEQLAAQPNEVEARRFAYNVCRTISSYSTGLRYRLSEIRWRGRFVGKLTADVFLTARDTGKLHFTAYRGAWFIPGRRNKDLYKAQNRAEIQPGRVAVVWYSPEQNLKSIEERVRKFKHSDDAQGLEDVLLVSCQSKNDIAFRRLLIRACRPERVFDLVNYVPDKKVRSAVTREKVKIKLYSESRRKAEYADCEVANGGWYVLETKKNLPHGMGYYELHRLMMHARGAGLVADNATVWLMPSSIEKATVKKGPWRDLIAYLTDAVTEDKKAVIDAAKLAGLAAVLNTGPRHEVDFYKFASHKLSAFMDIVPNTGLATMFAAFAAAEQGDGNAYANINTVRELLDMKPVPLPNMDAEKVKLSVFKGALAAYPMLSIVVRDGNLNRNDEQHLIDYVTLVDTTSMPVTLSAAA